MNTATPATKTAMMFAGEIFDGHDDQHPKIKDVDGNLHTVRVRAMPARHLGKVLNACTDEAALLGVVGTVAVKDETTGEVLQWAPVDEAFVDNLDDASHLLLVEAAKRLNFSRAASWGERQIEAKSWQAPLLLKADETLSPVVQKMVQLLISSLPSSALQGERSTKS